MTEIFVFKNEIKHYLSNYIIKIVLCSIMCLFISSAYNEFIQNKNLIVKSFSDDSIRIQSKTVIENEKILKTFFIDEMDNSESLLNGINEDVLYKVKSLKTPIGYLKYYNEHNIKIIGNEPTTGKNEVVIPSIICQDLKSKCSELINTNIDLKTETIDDVYKITGYYNSEKDLSDIDYLYTPFVTLNTDTQLLVTKGNVEKVKQQIQCGNCKVTTNKDLILENQQYFNESYRKYVILTTLGITLFLVLNFVINKKYTKQKLLVMIKLLILKKSNKRIILFKINESIIEILIINIMLIIVLLILNSLSLLTLYLIISLNILICLVNLFYELYLFKKRKITQFKY